MSSQPRTTSFDADTIRGEFPVFDQPLTNGRPVTFLDTAASAQKPRVVIDKERECYEQYYANAYRGVYQFGARVDEELEATREKVRDLINAEEISEIVFTSGTTMSINLVADSWGRKFLRPGDEILLNEMEHHANIVPWQQIANETGASVRYIPLTDDGRLDIQELDNCLTEKTAIIAVTGMSNVLGTINPVEELARRGKQVGALILVDGAQSVPHMPVDVRKAGIDFLTFSGHKIYGPSGVGVLYGRRELLREMDPFLTGGHMIDRVFKEKSTWAELPARFEAGTLPIAQAIALGAAIDFVNQLSFDAIHAHERRLLEHALARLQDEVPGFVCHGPGLEHRGAIISMTLEGVHSEDLAVLLDRRGVFVRHGHHCTMPLHDLLGVSATTRASFGVYNTLDDVDRLVDAIHFAREKLRLV